MVKHADDRRSKARPGDGGRSRRLDLLWGSRERPARGPRPGLSVDAIVRAALEVVDTEGLPALTMARVAAQLDVTTMALYRYVPGKEELVDLMVDGALGSPPAPGRRDWRAEVVRWARASRKLLQARPWLLEAVVLRAPVGPNWLAWLNAALEALSGSGLTDAELIHAALLLDGHVRSTAQLSAGAPATARWAEVFGRALRTASADPRYATLARVAARGAFKKTASPPDAPFEFGLHRLLDGIEAFVRARRRRAVP